MQIPVFVSVGSRLTAPQASVRDKMYQVLDDVGLAPRTVGVTDYPTGNPLREVVVLARHCAGALVLGFAEFEVEEARRVNKVDNESEYDSIQRTRLATPWNQIECGMCAALGLPLAIFREDGIEDGIFDRGITDLFLQRLPTLATWEASVKPIKEVLYQWRTQVQSYYYRV